MITCHAKLPDVEIVLPGSYEPRQSQLDDFEFAIGRTVSGNWSEVGTGKSLVAYMYATYHVLQGRKVIVAVPASLTLQFFSDFINIIKLRGLSVARINGDKKPREAAIAGFLSHGWPNVLVMGFAQLTQNSSLFVDAGYNVLVVDEADCLCGLSSQMFLTVSGLLRRRKWQALLLTATPHQSELAKAYGLISLVNPSAYLDFGEFEHKHIQYEMRQVAKDLMRPAITGYRDVKLLRDNLMAVAVRRRQSEVLTLDKPTISELKIDLPEAHSKAVNLIVKSWLVSLSPGQMEMVETVQKARMTAMQAVTNPEGFTEAKVTWVDEPFKALEEVIRQIGTVGTTLEAGKLVIFCHFRGTVKKLAEKLKHFNPALIYGEANAAEESHRFKTDPRCRVAIANDRSGGSGHNWQGVSSTVIFYEPVADVKLINQAIGRVSRSGQVFPVLIWFFSYKIKLVQDKWTKAKERAELLEEALGDNINFTDFIVQENPI